MSSAAAVAASSSDTIGCQSGTSPPTRRAGIVMEDAIGTNDATSIARSPRSGRGRSARPGPGQWWPGGPPDVSPATRRPTTSWPGRGIRRRGRRGTSNDSALWAAAERSDGTSSRPTMSKPFRVGSSAASTSSSSTAARASALSSTSVAVTSASSSPLCARNWSWVNATSRVPAWSVTATSYDAGRPPTTLPMMIPPNTSATSTAVLIRKVLSRTRVVTSRAATSRHQVVGSLMRPPLGRSPPGSGCGVSARARVLARAPRVAPLVPPRVCRPRRPRHAHCRPGVDR